jgi:hypothetical protein
LIIHLLLAAIIQNKEIAGPCWIMTEIMTETGGILEMTGGVGTALPMKDVGLSLLVTRTDPLMCGVEDMGPPANGPTRNGTDQ